MILHLNTFLKKSINILQESINLAESCFKTYLLKNKENLWNIFKQKLFETFGSKKYERYNIIRHDTELNEKLAQYERDYLEGERRDPPLLCYLDMMVKQIMNQIFVVKN